MSALAGVAQWTQCWPANQRVTGWFSVRARAWAVGQVPNRGMREATTHWRFSLSLSPSLPLSQKINKYNLEKKEIDLLEYHQTAYQVQEATERDSAGTVRWHRCSLSNKGIFLMLWHTQNMKCSTLIALKSTIQYHSVHSQCVSHHHRSWTLFSFWNWRSVPITL